MQEINLKFKKHSLPEIYALILNPLNKKKKLVRLIINFGLAASNELYVINNVSKINELFELTNNSISKNLKKDIYLTHSTSSNGNYYQIKNKFILEIPYQKNCLIQNENVILIQNSQDTILKIESDKYKNKIFTSSNLIENDSLKLFQSCDKEYKPQWSPEITNDFYKNYSSLPYKYSLVDEKLENILDEIYFQDKKNLSIYSMKSTTVPIIVAPYELFKNLNCILKHENNKMHLKISKENYLKNINLHDFESHKRLNTLIENPTTKANEISYFFTGQLMNEKNQILVDGKFCLSHLNQKSLINFDKTNNFKHLFLSTNIYNKLSLNSLTPLAYSTIAHLKNILKPRTYILGQETICNFDLYFCHNEEGKNYNIIIFNQNLGKEFYTINPASSLKGVKQFKSFNDVPFFSKDNLIKDNSKDLNIDEALIDNLENKLVQGFYKALNHRCTKHEKLYHFLDEQLTNNLGVFLKNIINEIGFAKKIYTKYHDNFSEIFSKNKLINDIPEIGSFLDLFSLKLFSLEVDHRSKFNEITGNLIQESHLSLNESYILLKKLIKEVFLNVENELNQENFLQFSSFKSEQAALLLLDKISTRKT